MSETELVVQVRGAYKRYGPNAVVLRGLNMTVERGTVYAFLGPSGCGKTTLLKCIVGRQHLDAGEILLEVQTKSDIGYMPQETALLEELTINETIAYYGRMFGMLAEDLSKRKKYLLGFLELPSGNRVIRDLSGGQARRVSLCIALLHDPKLLILDEPTVGVDPLLSHSIWQHLVELSMVQKKTIIITTHYIEEARQANKVGMMREGILLVEGNAPLIMEQYQCDTLEDVFLQLSHKQEGTQALEAKQAIENYPKPKVKPNLPLPEGKSFTLNHLISNLMKNIFFLKRSQITWFMLFFNPVIQCILFEMSVAEPKGLMLGWVNEEILYSDCNSFSNVTCFPSSCKYAAALNEENIGLIPYQDIHDAEIAVRKNRVWGYLHIHSNFTESLYTRIIKNKGVDDNILEQSVVAVSLDMSNQYIGNLLKKALTTSFFTYLDIVKADCHWQVDHIKTPLRFNDPVYGVKNPKFIDFSVIGVLLLIEFFLPVTYTLATLKDKLQGVQERNLVSGMTYLEILSGNAVVTLVIYAFQTFGMMCVLYGFYGHKIEGSIALALALIFLVGVSGMCFGYVIAVACDRDTTALYLALGTYVAITNLSGMFWPIEGMHYILRSVEWFLPLSLASNAFRSITARSWTLTHPVVYNGFLSVLFYIVFLCIIIYLIIKLKKRL
ncbi:ABC transporter G family member 20 [Halyomorpha halys]|uniref:ABC transporter G family member 20 n=1 Tax=Halyomorpha halys TaxID=286706 RepID=UPI0006D4E188|nr:ABC transporter G family member 23-like [Halyomorpha halys]